MRHTFHVCLILLAGAMVPLTAQAPLLPEPPDVGKYWVDPQARTAKALESAYSETDNGYRNYRCYFKGAQSSVQLPFGQQTFVMYAWATLEQVQTDALKMLERLTVDKGRRYGTGDLYPLDVATQGDRVFGLWQNGKKKDPGRQLFVITSREPLPLGEYAFVWGGSGITNAAGCGFTYPAFSVVPAAAGSASLPEGSAPGANPTAPASTSNPGTSDLAQLRAAADRGEPLAHLQLGELYARGQGGVLQDFVEAHKWLNLAAARLPANAQAQAAALRDEVARSMTPAQLADAQRAARDWLETFQRR